MNAFYRIGLAIVFGVIALSGAICVAFASPHPDRGPIAEHLGEFGKNLGPYQFVERSGTAVSEADLDHRVWVVSFIFTRCKSSCPRITTVMKDLQSRLRTTNASLVSITVDPENDTPAVLQKFADRYGADPARWWFLTGEKDATHRLILDRFQLAVSRNSDADRKSGADDFTHSDRLILIDRGNEVAGMFDSTDEAAVKRLVQSVLELEKKHRADDMGWPRRLPAVNATLNAACGLLLLLGWFMIRAGRVRWHAASMISALVVSAVFLTCYLVYHYVVGSVPFRGVGAIRLAYLTLLLSHTVLAIGVVPLVVTTLILAIRKRFVAHAKVARVTFPVWMYVSVTGVLVYWMLYGMDMTPYLA